jgi:hypothetical protein
MRKRRGSEQTIVQPRGNDGVSSEGKERGDGSLLALGDALL